MSKKTMLVFGILILVSIGVAFAGVAVNMKEVSFAGIIVLALLCGIVFALGPTSKY
jgi:hypothetical protein